VHFRLRGKTLDELRTINREELADIVDFANASGSLATVKTGAIPAMPGAAAIAECRKSVKKLLSN
jgi:fructokinase